MKKKGTAFAVAAFVLVWFIVSRGYIEWLAPVVDVHISEFLSMVIGKIIVPYLIALPISYLIIAKIKPDISPDRRYPFGEFITALIIQSGLVMAVSFFINSILAIAGRIPETGKAGYTGNSRLLYVFIILIFNPVFEEILFRKLALSRLRYLGNLKAVLISAGLFAFPHLFSQGISGMFSAFVMGIVWGYVTVKTNRLRYPIILHSLMNLWGSVLPEILIKSETGKPVYVAVWVVIVPITAIALLIINRKKIAEVMPRISSNAVCEGRNHI